MNLRLVFTLGRRIMRVRIPDDISVIGYDDILLARFLTPPLTTMHAPNFDMAKRAADSAFDEIYHNRSPLGGNFKTTLIERRSVAAFLRKQ